MRHTKKIMALFLCMQIMMVAVITGCSGQKGISAEEAKSTVVFTVEDYDVTLDQFYIYLIQYCFNSYLSSDDMNEAMEENVIDTTIEQMKLETVEYLLAIEMGIELTEEELSNAQATADTYFEYYGEEFLATYGVDKGSLEDLFIRQAYINAMVNQTTTNLAGEYVAQYESEFADTTFHSVYYALFPSIQYDAEGNAITGDDGKEVLLSDDQMNEQLVKAEELRNRALAGETMEELVEEYGIVHCSGVERNYKGAYAEELNAVIENMKTGDISEVVETEAGYMIVRMDNPDDQEYKEYLISFMAEQSANQLLPTLQETWRTQSGVSAVEPNEQVLDMVDVAALAEDMEKRNLYGQ